MALTLLPSEKSISRRADGALNNYVYAPRARHREKQYYEKGLRDYKVWHKEAKERECRRRERGEKSEEGSIASSSSSRSSTASLEGL